MHVCHYNTHCSLYGTLWIVEMWGIAGLRGNVECKIKRNIPISFHQGIAELPVFSAAPFKNWKSFNQNKIQLGPSAHSSL